MKICGEPCPKCDNTLCILDEKHEGYAHTHGNHTWGITSREIRYE